MRKKLWLLLCLTVLIGGQAFASCTSPANPIEAENCLPGTDGSQWQVGGAGDSTIQGFATDISVNAGQTISFKINTPASAYTIGIFRLGYYGGMGARKITTISPSATLPQTQPACLTDSVTRLYDCGNWAVSASWAVPSSAVSGVYLAVLVRSDTKGASQIPFIVRNDSSTSAMLFQTDDETWEAYNPYGGHSLYGPLNTFDLTNRAYKVSYNRPFTTLNLESESWLMYAEYPMIRWLEQNGYDVSYFASVDAARNGALIKNHKVFLSVGHDEYVSAEQRSSVEAARSAGVNLAFFSGNEYFWKTRWENSIDGSNTPYRTVVCYKETLGPNSVPTATAAVDPLDPPTWTGTWRDPSKSPPADGGRPENALTGQLFRVNGPGTDNTNLSIKVPAALGKFRFWRNTPNVATQANGATWTLPAGTLGYEWDVEEDNGSRPAGLFDVSSATYNLTSDYLQDYGGVYGAGTATHKMSLYRASSGALVFGAGTVQWSWGLDAFSGGAADTNMQQATVNLFADMGVQPATLQAGLLPATKSTDVTPPVSTITSPANGAAIQAGTTITVTGAASDSGGIVAGVEVSVDSGATWHPVTGTTSWSYTWVANTPGTFTVLSRAVDDSANLETPSAGTTVNIVGVSSLVLNPSTLIGGNSTQATVTLSAPAGPGGVTVTLTNSNPAVANVPASVLVPAGNTTFSFSIPTSVVYVANTATITATYASSATATLNVNPSFPTVPGTVAIDANVSAHQGTASTTITSGSFSTVTGNELILALITADALGNNMTVNGITGGGLTWTLVERTNAQGGTAEVWRAFAPTVLTNVTAVATFSQSAPAAAITIVSFAGVDTSGTNGSGAIGNIASTNSPKAAPSASLVTTRNNSWVIGVGNDYTSAIARTVGSNQTLIDQYFTPTLDTLWSQRQTAPTPASGTTVTINDTAPTVDSFNLSIVEVRPPVVGTLSISGTLGTNGAGATVTLSGAMSASVTADNSGNYSFGSLVSGSYTVTPTKTGFAFSPTSQAVTLTSSNASNVNFTAAQTFSISGALTSTGSGATVTLGGAGSATTTADASGNYTFGGVVNGTYTVTPTKTGVAFTPVSQNVTVNGANVGSVNFTAVQQNFSISGNLSANGANATVNLTGAGTATVTADASGNYTFTGLANGGYTVSPTKNGYSFTPASQNTTISGANITGLNFTAQPLATTNVAVDLSVPKDTTTASATISSPAFSTAAGNELLLAFVSTDYLGGTNTTVTGVTGGGLTWELVARSNVQKGSSEIWRAFATAPLTNATVTASLSQSVIASMTVMSFTGVDSTGVNGSGAIGATASKSATTGAPSASVVTTRNNSWVFGVGNDFDNAVARTPSSGQTVVHQYLTAAGDTYWVQKQNSTTPLTGTTVSISDTAPTGDSWNLAVAEVLPALGPYSISGSVTPVQAGTTMLLSGTVTTSTTLDGAGNYTFSGLPNGTYTVTPSKTGLTFNPSSQSVTINGSSVSGVNFTFSQPILALSQTGLFFTGNSGGANPAPATVNVTNTGGSTLNFTASSDSAWLSVSPASGTAPQTLQLSASLAGLSVGNYTGHVTVTSAGSANSPATITVTLKVTMATDWLMVDHDEARSGTAVDETTLSPSNIGTLGLLWSKVLDGSIVSQPLYAHSVVIGGVTRDIMVVGTGANTLWMLDANNGNLIWKRNFGAPTPNTWGLPDGFGIEAPPVIDRVQGRIYTVSTDGVFHTLSMQDGTDVFTPLTMIANPDTNKVWGGLNQYGNSVYIPSASNGGDTAPWRGQVYQVDVSAAPKLVGDFVVVPSIPAPNGGGGIWGYGGVSIDMANGNVYAASADDSVVNSNGIEGFTPMSDSIIALDKNVNLLNYYQAPQPAPPGCTAPPCDLDFASTPLIFQPAGCSQMLVTGNKNGNLYLFNSADLIAGKQPLQILALNARSDDLGSGGIGGTPEYDPATNMVYIADAGPGITGVSAGLVALNVTASCTLQVAWSKQIGGAGSPNSTPTIANGMVFVGEGDTGVIHAFNASTGTELWHSGTNYGAVATFAAPTVAGGKLFTGSWTSYSGGGIVGAFALPSTTFSISGTIASGSGATVSLSGSATATVTADGSGNYTFSGLANGSYTITPTKAGFTMNPPSQNVTVSGANVTAVNFTATAQTWSISGNVSANGAGATVTLSGAASATATADGSGNYTFSGLANGSYTVTPSKAGFTFNPVSQNVTVNGANVTGVNFTATATTQTWSVSGTLSASGAGATVTLSGASSGTVTADGSGNYTFSGLANGSYTVTPTKAGFTFNPLSQNVTVNGANVSGVNFTATAQTWSISGNVSANGAGATVALSGAATATVTADGSGNYTFSGLANGSYTVTPTKAGFTFNPASQNVTVNGANVTAVNFTAAAQTWSISGNVSANGAGATVALTGTSTGSVTADGSGNFTFTGLANGSYTITPTKTGYTFNPASQNATVNGTNVSGITFTATQNTSTGLAMDVNTSKDGTTASTTIASSAFSTKAGNELLLAFVATDYLSGNSTTVTAMTGGGLTWSLVKRTNVQKGDAEIWAAFAPAALSNVTVSATISQSVVCSITVISFTGVDTTVGTLPNAVGASGFGSASSGAPTASLVTTRNNSWVFGVGNDYDNAINRTPGTGQTVLHTFLTPTGDTYWVQMQNTTTPLSGTTVTINDTAPTGDRYNLTIVEVRTP